MWIEEYLDDFDGLFLVIVGVGGFGCGEGGKICDL